MEDKQNLRLNHIKSSLISLSEKKNIERAWDDQQKEYNKKLSRLAYLNFLLVLLLIVLLLFIFSIVLGVV